MKPHVLRMSAFGPYAGKQEIDFNDLGDNRLFLIHGPTGGGKTTILDAISYALYGVSSGNERRSENLRSDFADPTLATEVQLDFSVDDKTYRVQRSPRQTRPKKRSEGLTEVNPEAYLYELDDEGNEIAQLASKISTVTEQVEKIIGFRSEQFRQVIILPQGQFRKLLTASSDDREEILERLFDTSLFKLIQTTLKENAANLRKMQNELEAEQNTLLRTRECESFEDLVISGKEIAKKIKELRPKLIKAKDKEDKSRSSLAEAESVADLFDDLAMLKSRRSALDKQKVEIKNKRKTLKAAENALALEDLYEVLVSTIDGSEESEDVLLETAEDAAKAHDDLLTSKKARDEMRKRKPEIAKLHEKVIELRKYQESLGPILVARRAADNAQAKMSKVKDAEIVAMKALHSLKKQIELNQKSIRDLQKKVVDPAGLAARIAAISKYIEAKDKLEKLESEQAGSKNHLNASVKSVSNEKVRLKDAKNVRDQLRINWEAGQSARLAADLEPGSPCPVCGSKEHPYPAVRKEEMPSDAQLEEAEQSVTATEDALRAAKEVHAEASKAKSVVDKEVQILRESMQDKSKQSIVTLRKSLRELESSRNQQKSIGEELKEIEEELKRIKVLRTKAEAKLEAAQKAATNSKAELAVAKSVLAEKVASVPKQFQDGEKLSAALDKVRKDKVALEELVDSTDTNYLESQKNDAAGKAAHKAAKKDAEKAAKERNYTEQKWAGRLEKAGFTTTGAFEDASMTADKIGDIQTELKDYDEQVFETKTLLKKRKEELGDKKRPNIEKLKAAKEEATGRREVVDKRLSTHNHDQKQVKDLIRDLKALNKRLVKAQEEYGVIGQLSDVANGNNSKRMSFQRFVLATLLDEVLVAATERLYKMSSGRYQLLRAREQADQRSTGGLNLAVLDSHTGKNRPVETLSGGESFQAALSLALGLADVVQSYSGGIRMDTMFVDEGFGSLDAEALDLAINTLVDLQKDGRLVGVISHVADLKERIDVQLVVESGPDGSRASFRVP